MYFIKTTGRNIDRIKWKEYINNRMAINTHVNVDTFNDFLSAVKDVWTLMFCLNRGGIAMKDVYDFAKFFIKNSADSIPNTYDGNMKLQKLLVFANLVNLAQFDELLFDDEVLAFTNGCVVEKVRLRYKNDYYGLKRDSDRFEPDFTENEYKVLNTVLDIFGDATARELSELNHTFDFWKDAYKKGTDAVGYHDKVKSVVNFRAQSDDVERMKEVLDAYQQSVNDQTASEVINGVTYYYDDIQLSDEIIDQLERFSLAAEEDVYSIYLDDGKLVIC